MLKKTSLFDLFGDTEINLIKFEEYNFFSRNSMHCGGTAIFTKETYFAIKLMAKN